MLPLLVADAFRFFPTDLAVVQLINTTPRLGRFFKEVGRPVKAGTVLPLPSQEDLRRFVETSARYGSWMGSPEENAAVGIRTPSVGGGDEPAGQATGFALPAEG